MELDFKEDCYYLTLDAGEGTEYAIEFDSNVRTFSTYSYSYYGMEIWDASPSFDIDKPTDDDSFRNLLLKIKPYLTIGKCSDLQELELDEDIKQELIEFFLDNLNYEPYITDPYIASEDLNSSYSITYSHNLNGYDLESILQMILIYLHITNVELEMTETDYDVNYWSDYCKLGLCTLDIMNRICNLVSSVVNIEGFEYGYNDGAYNRQSGYSKEGFFFYYDIETDYLSQDVKDYLNYIKPKSNIELTRQQIAELKGLSKKPAFLVEHTRKLIYWLRIVQPLGINNVKKLEKYLNG